MNNEQHDLEFQTLILSKAGAERFECEDSIGSRVGARRFCVADGATEGFDSRRWARLLTKHWVYSERSLLTREQLSPWLCALGQSFRERWAKKSLPWYAEEKARSGAFAAFLGIGFFESPDCLSWQAIAIGDSCLIHIRDQKVQLSFPISDPTQFGYHPFLAPSDDSRLEASMDRVVVKDGRARIGDVFLLLTDAIAAWYLEAVVTAPDAVRKFDSAMATGDHQQLDGLIRGSRANATLRNDDVAALRIAVVSRSQQQKG